MNDELLETGPSGLDLKGIYYALFRQKWKIILFALAGLLGAVGLYVSSPPLYQSEAKVLVHNEEHLALETDQAARFMVGDVLYGVPFHVCPTCAMHRFAHVVDDGKIVDRWEIVARDRVLSI